LALLNPAFSSNLLAYGGLYGRLQSVLARCASNYKQLSERNVNISVDKHNWLKPDLYVVQRVCVEPRSSALNTTRPATELWRQRQISTSSRYTHRSISAARARAQQQTSSTSLRLSIDGTDRRTVYRYIDAVA